jgi:acetyl esterase/lipase
VLHGLSDNLIPAAQARSFAERLRAQSSAPVAYAELPGAPHAFDMLQSVRATAAVHVVSRFLGAIYGDYVRSAD